MTRENGMACRAASRSCTKTMAAEVERLGECVCNWGDKYSANPLRGRESMTFSWIRINDPSYVKYCRGQFAGHDASGAMRAFVEYLQMVDDLHERYLMTEQTMRQNISKLNREAAEDVYGYEEDENGPVYARRRLRRMKGHSPTFTFGPVKTLLVAGIFCTG